MKEGHCSIKQGDVRTQRVCRSPNTHVAPSIGVDKSALGAGQRAGRARPKESVCVCEGGAGTAWGLRGGLALEPARLCGGIVDLAGVAEEAHHGSDVDDAARLLLAHDFAGFLRDGGTARAGLKLAGT